MFDRGAFARTSPVLSLVILVTFGALFVSLAYNLGAFTPQQFVQQPAASTYENKIQEIRQLDEFSRTVRYWTNNLSVAGTYAVLSPTYIGFAANAINGYTIGVAVSYYNALGEFNYILIGDTFQLLGGWRVALAYTSSIFVHGFFELTGIFLVSAAAIRLAWNFWRWLGRAAELSMKDWGAKRVLKLARRRRSAIMRVVRDFLVVFAFGALLIFIAAPMETYVAPIAFFDFMINPALSASFLAAVGMFYVWLFWNGFKSMVKVIRKVLSDLRLLARGKFKSSQLPAIMLAVLMLTFLLRYFS